MDKNIHDNSFLARWISGDLSSEELENFKKSRDFELYSKINKVSQEFETPAVDKEKLFSKINKQLKLEKSNESKVVKLIPNWAYAVAASIVIAFGLFYMNNLESHYQTNYSEQMAVVLPDNSQVELNSNTELYFSNKNWEDKRELTLNGEAFFDVEKGESFKVNTKMGVVEVLGTEFNVISRGSYFEVLCKEGKVKVISFSGNKEVVLTPGNAMRVVDTNIEKWSFNIQDRSWLMGESTFYNAPLHLVLKALENQYEINFDTSNIDLDKRFTGGFSHKNIKLALKTVLQPMDLSYTYNELEKIILVNSKD